MHCAKVLAYLLRLVLDNKNERLNDLLIVLSRTIRRLRLATGCRRTGVSASGQAEVMAREVNV